MVLDVTVLKTTVPSAERLTSAVQYNGYVYYRK